MSRFLDALHGRNYDRPPLWMMRQAGRYQPSYQAIRATHSIEEMFHNVDLICQVTKLPIEEFPLDAAILFSDILLPLELLGYSVTFDGGPKVRPGRKVDSLSFVYEAIRRLKQELSLPLIGFVGAPFTVASYSDESLLDPLSEVIVEHAKNQVEAGVDALQVFDSWAGKHGADVVNTKSIPYVRKIVDAVDVPVIVFSRRAGLYEYDKTGAMCVSVDWETPLPDMRKKWPHLTLQGNLNPDILCESKEEITKKTLEMLESMEGDPAYIGNLGHGLSPKIPYENVQHFVTTWQSAALSTK